MPSPITVAAAAPPAPSALRPHWLVAPRVSFGFVNEPSVGDALPLFTLGLAGAFGITPDVWLELWLRDAFARRTYLSPRLDPLTHLASSSTVEEQKLSGQLFVTYPLLKLFKVESSRVQVTIVGGPSFHGFLNDTSPTVAGGVGLGGKVRYAFSEQLDVSGGGVWTYNLFFRRPTPDSALGGPQAVSTLDGAFGLTLAPNTRLSLGYEGDVVTLEHSLRWYHTFSVALSLAL